METKHKGKIGVCMYCIIVVLLQIAVSKISECYFENSSLSCVYSCRNKIHECVSGFSNHSMIRSNAPNSWA